MKHNTNSKLVNYYLWTNMSVPALIYRKRENSDIYNCTLYIYKYGDFIRHL